MRQMRMLVLAGTFPLLPKLRLESLPPVDWLAVTGVGNYHAQTTQATRLVVQSVALPDL